MTTSFAAINSAGGRIGRICWINSDTRHQRPYGWAWLPGHRYPRWRSGGWWGSCYLASPHPATPGEAW